MRAILLDAKTRTVSEVDYDGDYKSIYGLIGCQCFTVVQLGNGDDLYVDDEGLLTMNESTVFIQTPWYPTPLAGSGLILSCDDEGESQPATHGADYYRSRVRFMSAQAAWLAGQLGGEELGR
jgi:hypothetical protein